MNEYIPGRNGVLEALKSGDPLHKIFVAEGAKEGSIREIIALARDKGIPIAKVNQQKLNGMYEGNHQGVVAVAAAYDYVEIEDLLALAKERGEKPFLLLLAAIESPQNLGAIIRTAESAGVHGIIIPKDNSVGLNATVAKVAVGAASYLPVARVANLNRAVEKLKSAGLWVYGGDMAGQCLWQQEMTGPILLIIGGENKGIPRLLKENCDFLISIPMFGHINSLNASAATAVLVYEAVRQRGNGKK